MSRIEKLLKRFLENPQSLKFKKIEKVLHYLGFSKVQAKGSHIKYTNVVFNIKFTIPIHNNDCAPVYKEKMAKKILNNFPI